MNKFFVQFAVSIILFSSFVFGDVSEIYPVDERCMECLCHAMSGCDQNAKCAGDICGAFKITWPYWADSGKPTLQGEDVSSQTAYPNCVTELSCAKQSVQGYMAKFRQDCNGDGNVDCFDFAAIHKLGGYGCKGYLPEDFALKMQDCLQHTLLDTRIDDK